MQREQWSDFEREMSVTCEAFDRKYTKALADAYWSALEKMSFPIFSEVCKFSRSKAGQEGWDRLPKPGRFWALREEIRRNEKPKSESTWQSERLSSQAHLAILYRNAIEVAKRETMPAFKGVISRNVPDLFQIEHDAKWREWDKTHGQESDEYWRPRAEQLMQQWGNKPQPQHFDPTEALVEF
jgi:hypothetical protein